MGIKFFGQYLLENKKVTKKELLNALQFQTMHNLKTGEMGVALGLLCKKDVDRIHLEQRSNDMRFGDLSLKLGILTESKLASILAEQKKNHMSIGDILVSQNALTSEELEIELVMFYSDQKQYEMNVPLPENNPCKEIISAAISLTVSMSKRVGDLNAKVGNWTQFESGQTIPRKIILIPLMGMLKGYYFISMPNIISSHISSNMFKEFIDETNIELCDDAIKEFANIVAGNIVSKVSTDEEELDIGPPELFKEYAFDSKHQGIQYDLYSAEATYYAGVIWETK